MSMKHLLSFPFDLPRWATNAGRTLEPPETGTILSNKDLGWLLGDEPPARWLNWLENLYYKWIIFQNTYILGKLKPITIDTNPWLGIIYNQEIGQWLLVRSSTANQYSTDGENWSAGTALPGAAFASSLAIDGNYLIAAGTSSDIYYTADVSGSWSTDTGPTSMVSITKLVTKYPDSDFIAAADSLGAVMFAASGVGTSWASPSVGPSYTGIPNNVGFIHIENDSFMILSAGAETKISTDNCDNWGSTTTDPDSVLTSSATGLAHNRDDNVIIAIGTDGTDGKVARTDDSATTWTESTIKLVDGQTVVPALNDPYYLGSKIWLIACDQTDDNVGLLVSYDNGLTFCTMRFEYVQTTSLNAIGCDGSQVCIAAGSGTVSAGSVYTSGSIPKN